MPPLEAQGKEAIQRAEKREEEAKRTIREYEQSLENLKNKFQRLEIQNNQETEEAKRQSSNMQKRYRRQSKNAINIAEKALQRKNLDEFEKRLRNPF